MRIALDAMGGDKAPEATVQGGIDAARELGVEVVLVGKKEIISPLCSRLGKGVSSVSLVDASQSIGMEEHPMEAIRQKPDSSIVKGLGLLKSGEADAFVSAGSTGSVVAASFLLLGCIPGIERPAIALLYSTLIGDALFLDAGANADCRPQMLLQFGQMGSLYMERVYGLSKPRVALLNIGEESTKGSRLTQGAYPLLQGSGLNFIGNIEGKDVYKGIADVVVTDGFTGNVALKLSEGLSEAIFRSLHRALATGASSLGISTAKVESALSSFVANWDYSELGGAYLLGINGNVIIAHGRSDPQQVKNAIAFAKKAVEGGILQALLSSSEGV